MSFIVLRIKEKELEEFRIKHGKCFGKENILGVREDIFIDIKFQNFDKKCPTVAMCFWAYKNNIPVCFSMDSNIKLSQFQIEENFI